MVISKIYKVVVLAVSLLCAGSCFSKNKANADVTEFSNALGVFFLLILQRAKPTSFISQFATQVTTCHESILVCFDFDYSYLPNPSFLLLLQHFHLFFLVLFSIAYSLYFTLFNPFILLILIL